jgi:anti-sigma B factor antagonist
VVRGRSRRHPRDASGELDIATAPQLADALSEAARGSAAVILDVRELTFMDSSCLHAILIARARLNDADCRLALVRGCHEIQRIFAVTGTEHALEFASAPDAVLST